MKTVHAGPTRGTLGAALTFLSWALLAGCDNAIDPATLPNAVVEASSNAFTDADPLVGSDEVIRVEVMNVGGATLIISEIALEGGDAAEFALGATGPFTVPAGGALEVPVMFAPASLGAKSAKIVVASNDPGEPRIEISVMGRGASFQYAQVDRKGIPTLNTVFNHASGIAGFSKKAYNVVAPSSDLATYRSQFEVVLGAVANPDPAATAALLLPDELPVSLGAATSFATLTGRALADDAVDVALSVTVGVSALQSDNVDANDKPFRTTFPYVATPH